MKKLAIILVAAASIGGPAHAAQFECFELAPENQVGVILRCTDGTIIDVRHFGQGPNSVTSTTITRPTDPNEFGRGKR
jgi:hypothetical protein